MPCQSYETNWANDYDDRKIKELKKQSDKLARIACAAMTELESNGISDVLLLKNDELREWWAAHKEADRKEQARLAEIERKNRIKAEALARLSDEEKELLGLAPAKKSKRSKKDNIEIDELPSIERLLKKLNGPWEEEDGEI